jgi:dihydrofolate reductase
VGKLVVTSFITLDNVVEEPHRWSGQFQSEDTGLLNDAVLREADGLLLGRVTYEGFAAAWPERGGEFADKMNGMRKVVASTNLENHEWNNTEVIRDAADGVATLKAEDGGPILVAGSRTLVHSLIEHDLVDELRLLIFPVVLGSGARLFPERPDKTKLELVDTRTFPSGVTANTYRPG